MEDQSPLRLVDSMKYNVILFSLLFFTNDYGAVTVAAKQHGALPVMISIIKDNDVQVLNQVAQTIKRDCEFMGQCSATIQLLPEKPKHSSAIKAYYKTGVPFVVMLNHACDNKAIEWRLYDTMKGVMLKGKRYKKYGTTRDGWAHAIADDLWQTLTNQAGVFSTKLVYCKREFQRAKVVNSIWVADYDGTNCKKLVDTSTINIAPRWNADPYRPLVFYSSYLDSNVKLMVCDMHKQSTIASNFDGLNILPAFSPDKKQMVYCLSRGDGRCQLYYYTNGTYKWLTNNTGNNISPTFGNNGKTIFYCSDIKGCGPRLCAYHLDTDLVEEIVTGFCATPRYSERTNNVAFSKLVDGCMQLFTYNVGTKKVEQITFTKGNKEECSWSPCGNYLLYALHDGKTSRIAQLNLITKKERLLTTAQEYCSYPDWSRSFARYPVT